MGKERIKRTEAYAEQVRRLFAETVNEILALYKAVPELGEGEMFSFDADGQARRDKTTRLLRRLHSVATEAVRQGVKLEWGEANKEADAVIADLFGEEVRKNPAFAGWTKRNGKAAERFMNRAEDGIDLSDRIWKTVKQLREEMEVAMTVSIGEGESASSMSRKVRQYLNDPDLMFRRFKYKIGEDKDGKPVYGRKWKKRVKDEATGRYRWEDYDKDSYKVGRGYYKSSAKNAMRVTRTETNIAYRRADNLRWRQMDFVLGYHVEPSKAHPKPDICDKLKGDYPKWFNFDGWHPQCFCVCTPILLNDDEAMEMMLAKRDGKTYTPKQKPIDAVPANFSEWVRDNADKIAEARERGTEPYFLANNKQAVDDFLHPKPKELTTPEKAELRHKARTQEQIDDIKKRWEERQHKHALIKKTADNVLNVAQDYGEVDYSELQTAIEAGDLTKMQTLAKTVARSVSAVKKQEASISYLIPDVHVWHQQFTTAELQSAHSAIESKLADLSGKTLAEQKKILEKEIKYVEDPTFLKPHTQYPTWKVVQDAYLKKLDEVNNAIAINGIKTQLDTVAQWSLQHQKSIKVANLLADAKESIANGEPLSVIKQKADLATAEYQKRLAEQARRNAKKSPKSTQFKPEDYTQDRKDNAVWAKDTKDADFELRPLAGKQWIAATQDEKKSIWEYTGSYHNIQEPLRGLTYYGSDSVRKRGEENIANITTLLNKCKSDRDVWFQRGDRIGGADKNPLAKFGIGYPPDDNQIKALVGKEGIEPGFWSMGVAKGEGFGGDIIWNIYLPKGSKYMYIEPISKYGYGAGLSWDGKSGQTVFGESEALLQRGTKLKVTKVEKKGSQWYIDVDVIEQSPVAFPYVNGVPK